MRFYKCDGDALWQPDASKGIPMGVLARLNP